MSWTDDDLERSLGRLNPAREVTDDMIDTARAQARMDAAIAAHHPASRPARSRPRVRRRVVLVAAACAVAVVVAVGIPLSGLTTTPAAAYGPPPLRFTLVDKTVREVVRDAQNQLREDTTGVGVALRESTFNGWFAQIDGNATEDALTAIHSQNHQLTWNADLSGQMRVTAGTPYHPDGTPVTDPTPTPGTVLYETTYEAGQISPPFGEDPVTNTDALAPLLTGPDGRAAEAANGIASLLNTWTLPNTTHAALLNIFLQDPDVSVEGTATDRAGRPTIGLRATSTTTPWFDVTVLISTDTGRIIGLEETYTGLQDQLPIPPGTITGYTLWETTQ